MRDKRPVDELTVAELERILVIKKREARQQRLRQFDDRGRRLPMATATPVEYQPDPPPEPQQHEAAREIEPVEPPHTYDITDDVPRFEDELDVDIQRPHRARPRQAPAVSTHGPAHTPQRVLFDNVLLGIEIIGIVGIVALLILGAYLVLDENSRIDELEARSAQIQRDAEAMRPTPSPIPELSIQLNDYVLPGGHIYQDGIGTFNLDELPASIRPVAIAQLNVAPQADIGERPSYSPATIEIPAIGLKPASIWGGNDWYQLQKGVGHLLGSANPGEDANMVLAAHNDIYGEIFRDIGLLEPGDEIRIQALDGRWYTYEVFQKEVVNPTDVWVMERGNEPMVTLITCHPYQQDYQRMVVFARLVEK